MSTVFQQNKYSFAHCCVLQVAYCAVVMVEDFDAMEVCCETVVTCVELEIIEAVLGCQKINGIIPRSVIRRR